MSKSSQSNVNSTQDPPSPNLVTSSSFPTTSPGANTPRPGAASTTPNSRWTPSNGFPRSHIPTLAQSRVVSAPDDAHLSSTTSTVHAGGGQNRRSRGEPREPVPFSNPFGFPRSRSSQVAAGRSAHRSSSASRDRPGLHLNLQPDRPPYTTALSSYSAHHHHDLSAMVTPSDSGIPTLTFDHPDEESPPPNIVYERQLLQKKHGFPLYTPSPNVRLPKSYVDKGVSVGDVGIVTPYGSFDYLFNVCLHAEHPNNAGQVPEGFVPLLIHQKDISETHEHGNGSFLCSSSVASTHESASTLSFQSQESEGAILTMPEGAVHEDVRNLSKFREYAAIHAHSWYKLANGLHGREIENGELHLVTGCDKTTSWGIATFARVAGGALNAARTLEAPPSTPQAPSVSLEFTFSVTDSSSADGEGCVCAWGSQQGNAEVRSISNTVDSDGNRYRNQCTFFRSHTVTLSEAEWAKIPSSVTVDGGYASDATSDTASRTSGISSGKGSALRRLFSTFRHGASGSQRAQPAVTTHPYTEMPQRQPHPSSLINKLLLHKHPRARVAITHDEEWAALIPDPCNPPAIADLWEDVQLKFDIILDASGSVYLTVKEAFSVKLDQATILTDLDLPATPGTKLPLPSTPRTATSPTTPGPKTPEELIDQTKHTAESLVESIASSKNPSAAEARLLVKMLSTSAPPPFTAVQRAMFSLFASSHPPNLHAYGFEVLAAYWENPLVKEEDEPRMTSDRLSCFAFFLETSLASWTPEHWETQFKALQAVTDHGKEIKGIEVVVIDMLERWILVTFQRLVHMSSAPLDPKSTAECERCARTVGMYLVEVLKISLDNVARIYDEVLIDVLRFHAVLIDQLILLPGPQGQATQQQQKSPVVEKKKDRQAVVPSHEDVHVKKGHKKRPSSISLSSIMFSAAPPMTPIAPMPSTSPVSSTVNHPAILAISLFVEQLSEHMLNLKASQLLMVLPPLFRALAFCASPLPRLALKGPQSKPTTLEERIVYLLNTLVPTASFPTCIRALKIHLFPSKTVDATVNNIPTQDADTTGENNTTSSTASPSMVATASTHLYDAACLMIMTGLGASRTLRNFVRKALAARLESAYHPPQETPGSAMRTTSSKITNSRTPIDQDLLDVVWLPHTHPTNPTIDPAEKSLASSIDAWVAWETDLPAPEAHSPQQALYEKVKEGRDDILEENAGILKDIYQEFDSREETTIRDECELEPINDALKCLCTYLVSLQSPDGSPFVMDVFLPANMPTPLLRSISTLLSRDFGNSVDPVLAEVLLLVRDHVKDENTARIPGILKEKHQLWPITPQWIENWKALLGTPTLLNASRPLTRKALLDTLHDVYFSIKDVPSQRQALAKLVIDMIGSIVGPQFCEPVWEILEDDATIVVSELLNTLVEEDDEQEIPSSIRILTKLVFSQPEAVALPIIRSLINIFSEISFTPLSGSQTVQKVSLYLFVRFVRMLTEVQSVACRLLLLQFLMRLRAARNHRVYLAVESCDTHDLISYLASLINRVPDSLMKAHKDEILEEHVARTRQNRSRVTISHTTSSTPTTRSRSRTLLGELSSPQAQPQTEHVSLWQLPETLGFKTIEPDSVKNFMISYDPDGPGRVVVLPISTYLHTLATLIESDASWELVSYILCHLPTQLSNKHLFCGPKNRASVNKLLLILTTGIIRGHLASQTANDCPEHLKLRDLQGLAQHTLSTMISYKLNFDLQQRQLLLEAFQSGLDGPFSTIKCCLHALTLSAYEMPNSLSKAMPQILEKLSQIMSNPNMAVHILAFLNIVGSLPSLYASFTDDDFKMVFGVALQYLQHYNQLRESPTRSWALSQHVRQQSYCAVYTWFMVLKLPDRKLHIPYITRQLLLANEGKDVLDGMTQVCFDWLARNTYGMTNAKTIVHDIVLQPNIAKPEHHLFKKTWMMGNSFISVRPIRRPGWLEFMSRRPSGSASLMCRKDDFVAFARHAEVKETASFLEALEDASEALEAVASPLVDVFSQEAHSHPQTEEESHDYDLIAFASRLLFHLSPIPEISDVTPEIKDVTNVPNLPKSITVLDRVPVIDTHKVGILYVAPGQTKEMDILRNSYGSQGYTRFLDGIGRLIHVRTEKDVYTGSLDPNEDGEYAYAWWDDIRQILFHTATLMPAHEHDPIFNYKKRHIGNDYVRIVWNDSGLPYRFDTLSTAFQFVNIVIEPHSLGTISAFSNDAHENEYFRVIVQTADNMTECTPVGQFKIVSAVVLPQYIRQLVVLTDCFTSIFSSTARDTQRVEIITNWNARLDSMGRFKKQANDYFQSITDQNNTSVGTNEATST